MRLEKSLIRLCIGNGIKPFMEIPSRATRIFNDCMSWEGTQAVKANGNAKEERERANRAKIACYLGEIPYYGRANGTRKPASI
jgi:hypothetical protein